MIGFIKFLGLGVAALFILGIKNFFKVSLVVILLIYNFMLPRDEDNSNSHLP